jgi:hypothetical protein
LGPRADEVLRFWLHLDALTAKQWAVARAIAKAAAWGVEWDAAWDVAVSPDVAWDVARSAAWASSRNVLESVAEAAAGASNEIQGADRLSTFYFLPMFGIASLDQLKVSP